VQELGRHHRHNQASRRLADDGAFWEGLDKSGAIRCVSLHDGASLDWWSANLQLCRHPDNTTVATFVPPACHRPSCEIPRVDAATTSKAAFDESFCGQEAGPRPAMIAGLTDGWPAHARWTKDALLAKHGDAWFTISGGQVHHSHNA
jgi:hypothetical protein